MTKTRFVDPRKALEEYCSCCSLSYAARMLGISPSRLKKIITLKLAKQPNRVGFYYRALWNAFVTKVEEEIANEYANDPDRYYEYLLKRWSSNSFWRNVLKIVRSSYVQSRLTVYLKNAMSR